MCLILISCDWNNSCWHSLWCTNCFMQKANYSVDLLITDACTVCTFPLLVSFALYAHPLLPPRSFFYFFLAPPLLTDRLSLCPFHSSLHLLSLCLSFLRPLFLLVSTQPLKEKLLALDEVTQIAYHNWISVRKRQRKKREWKWVKPVIDLTDNFSNHKSCYPSPSFLGGLK